jgi:hypothetical protein
MTLSTVEVSADRTKPARRGAIRFIPAATASPKSTGFKFKSPSTEASSAGSGCIIHTMLGVQEGGR